MKDLITKLNKEGNSFGFLGPQAIRWFLAVFLIYKGVYFIHHTDLLIELIKPADIALMEMAVFHYVCLTHLCGGVLLLFGLLSRLAAIAQIPILIGAITANYFAGDGTQIIISSGILILLVITTVYGSGKHSADYRLKMYM